MADNYIAVKSSQKKRYISKETFNKLDLTQIPIGSEYDIVGQISQGDLSSDIVNSLNKADGALQKPTNQTTGSDGDVLVKKGGGSEWKSMPVPGVVQATGQSTTDVMSQKATTDSLNLLEAKLNENIVKDPSKTYIVWKGSKFSSSDSIPDIGFRALAGSTIDWGDGTIETFETASTEFTTHAYTDGIEYHLIVISGLSLDPSAFLHYNGLVSIAISNNIDRLENYAFAGDTNLVNVIIPNSVTSIGWGVFSGCSGLTSITIPNSVTSIDYSAFQDCSSLTSITSKSTTPPTLSSSAIPTTIEKIIVPKSAINAYKSAAAWSTYADKIVYEVDSSDLPDTRKFAKLDENNVFDKTIEVAEHIFLKMGVDADGDDGFSFASGPNLPTYMSDGIKYKQFDATSESFKSYKLAFPTYKSGTLALTTDIPDTSNLSSFSVEVW